MNGKSVRIIFVVIFIMCLSHMGILADTKNIAGNSKNTTGISQVPSQTPSQSGASTTGVSIYTAGQSTVGTQTEGTATNSQIPLMESKIKPPSVQGEAAILIDAKSGQILYSKNAHKKMFPASITKVLTALVALENCNLDDVFTADAATLDYAYDGTNAAMKMGEQVTIDQLLYFTMIVSGNDAANALGQYVSGDVKTFCEKMNQRAKELGCLNTYFWNTNGLNDEVPSKDKHMTTAYDMSLIMKKAVEIPKFVEIISTYYYETGPTNKTETTRKYRNSNQLINESSEFYYEYCVGGKTGWTTPAGNTLVTYGKKNGRELICVILKANGKQNAYKDTENLYEYGFNEENFKTANLNMLANDTGETNVSKKVIITENGKAVGETTVSLDVNDVFYFPNDIDLNRIKITIDCPDSFDKNAGISPKAEVEIERITPPNGFLSQSVVFDMKIDEITYYPQESTVNSPPLSSGASEETMPPEGSAPGGNGWIIPVLLGMMFVIIIAAALRAKRLKKIRSNRNRENIWRIYNED